MFKYLQKIFILVSLLSFTSCSFVINKDSKFLDKLNEELGIDEYESARNDSFKITYNLDGGTNSDENPESFSSSSSIITLKDAVKKGYKFSGWYSESTFRNKITEINPSTCKNYVLYASWKLVTYTITYNLDGGTNSSYNSSTYSINSNTITLKKPEKKGYKFLGWYTESTFETEITEIDTSVCENFILYAKWGLIDYTITYNLNGGINNEDNPDGFALGEDIIQLLNPSKEHYYFMGWFLDSDFNTVITQINPDSCQDYILYAGWVPTNYTITYVLDGGINNVYNPSSHNIEESELVLYAPYKTGYQFEGWFTDPDFINPISSIESNTTGEITLYAKWLKGSGTLIIFNTETDKIKITVDSNNGNQINLSATEGFNSYKWIYDDTILPESSNSVTINITESGYHYITVLAIDESGLQYSAQCSIRRKDTQTSSSSEGTGDDEQSQTFITISYLVDDSESVSISTSSDNKNLLFTATDGFDSYKWIVDETIQEETSNTLVITEMSEGYHLITVICQKNSNSYSHSISLRKTTGGNNDSEKTSAGIELLTLTNDISTLPISVSSSSSKYTFSVDSGYDDYTWYVDDTILQNETNSITLSNLTAGYHYISVLAKKAGISNVSSTCTVRITEMTSESDSGETDTEGKAGSKVIVLSLNNDSKNISIETSYSSGNVILTTTKDYSSYKWILDDEVLEENTYTLTLSNLTSGYHFITVTAQDSTGSTVSNYIKIRKTE